MGIDLFDKLFDIAKRDVADEKAYLRKIKDKDVFGQLSQLQKELQGYKEQKEKLDKEVEPYEVRNPPAPPPPAVDPPPPPPPATN